MSETKSTRQVIGASRRRYTRPRAQVEKSILYQLGHAPPPRKNRRKLRVRPSQHERPPEM